MIVLDSSFLIAFKVKNDVHHERAEALMKQVVLERYGRPVITDYIFDETVTSIFVRSKSLASAVEYGEELLHSLEIVEVDQSLFLEAWKIFASQKNSELSFTDATTIAVVNTNDRTKIATFDRDFEVKGSNTLGL
jgi:predicted nucleic acid-binding protein